MPRNFVLDSGDLQHDLAYNESKNDGAKGTQAFVYLRESLLQPDKKPGKNKIFEIKQKSQRSFKVVNDQARFGVFRDLENIIPE